MIEIKNVTARKGAWFFRGSIKIESGQRVWMTGPSGHGKSSFLDLIAGFTEIENGNIYLCGKCVTKLSPHEIPVSIMFQNDNLFPHLSIMENIGLVLNPKITFNEQQKYEITRAAKKVGIEKHLQAKPHEISGGQKQRAAFARFLLRTQPILLLDEPFSALDTITHEKMLIILKDICDSRKLTLVLVSHDKMDASIANKCLKMVDGCLKEANSCDTSI